VATAPRTRWPVQGRTELDAAPCPDREEPEMRACAAQPVRGAAWADGYPLSRFWPLPRLRRLQGVAPAGRSGVAGTPAAGETAHAGWPAPALAAGTGHRETCRCRSPRTWRCLVRCRCPGHLLVPPGGRCGGCWSCLECTLGVALPWAAYPRARFRGWRSWRCGPRARSCRRGPADGGQVANRGAGPQVLGTAAGATGGWVGSAAGTGSGPRTPRRAWRA
jgi:hypothetical protein